MRRTAGGGTRSAQPAGVPVRSTSPGAMFAKVDSSEIVSAGLKTRFRVEFALSRGAVHRELELEVVETAELIVLEGSQPRAQRTESAVALPLKNWVCGN